MFLKLSMALMSPAEFVCLTWIKGIQEPWYKNGRNKKILQITIATVIAFYLRQNSKSLQTQLDLKMLQSEILVSKLVLMTYI